MMKEVKGFEGLYYITDDGRVYNAKGTERKPRPNHKGYLTVNLCKGGKQYIKRVHRLVAEAFIPNPENKPQVNHLNGDKQDNTVANLEWATNSDNQRHACRTGLRKCHRVEMLDMTGKYLRTFYSIAAAERYVGAKCPNGTGITNALKKGHAAYGFRWRSVSINNQ